MHENFQSVTASKPPLNLNYLHAIRWCHSRKRGKVCDYRL